MKKARSRAQHGKAFSFESPPTRITKGNPATHQTIKPGTKVPGFIFTEVLKTCI
jgi:hypothetical protein